MITNKYICPVCDSKCPMCDDEYQCFECEKIEKDWNINSYKEQLINSISKI